MYTPGTAQIGEGIENSWGDFEELEKEEAAEEEGEDDATAFECQKMEIEDTNMMEETKTGNCLNWYHMCLYHFINSLGLKCERSP